MKMLVTSDVHYALRQYDWLVSVAPQYDLVVLAGDLLDVSSVVEPRAQIVVVRAYLEELSRATRVIVCSGNHDLDAKDEAGERSASWMAGLAEIGVLADGGSTMIGGTLFSAFQWWDGPSGKAAIAAQLAEAARLPRERWVWVYHAPPANSPVSWNGRRHFGDMELSHWIEEFSPEIVLSGHVHPAPFTPEGSWADRIGRTWVFNPGQQVGPVPAHIILRLDSDNVLWSSFDAAQELRLDTDLTRPIASLREEPGWLKA